MGIFKNKMKINQSQKYLDNTDTHFLNRNYRRTGRADSQTDQQHWTSRILICWLKVAWAAWCCCRAHGLTFEFVFEFQVVRESNRSTIEGPLYIYIYI